MRLSQQAQDFNKQVKFINKAPEYQPSTLEHSKLAAFTMIVMAGAQGTTK